MNDSRRRLLDGSVFTLLASIRAIKNASKLSFEEELYVVWCAMSRWAQDAVIQPPKEDPHVKKTKKSKEQRLTLYSAGYDDLKFAGINPHLHDMLESTPPRGNEKAYVFRHNPDGTTEKIYKWRDGKWRKLKAED